jgi:hypothetical protein
MDCFFDLGPAAIEINVKTRDTALILIWFGNSRAAIETSVSTRGTALHLVSARAAWL